MYYYSIYGLVISSPIEFPEAEEITNPAQIDANIRFEKPPQWVVDEYNNGSFSSLSEDIMWFRLYDKFLIYVEKGSNVLVWILTENVPEIQLRSYILTGAMTFLMLQRNYLLIHGSAIVYQSRAFLLSGPSGSGKSTTTLELLKNPDIFFATDDICALSVSPHSSILFPGPPWQKVCSDVKEADTTSEYLYLWEGEKYARRLTKEYCRTPVPIGGMFLISKSSCTSVTVQELSGLQKLDALTNNLFRGELLNILGITPARMQQFLYAVTNFPIYEIQRPENSNTINSVKGEILRLTKKFTE